MSEYNDKEQDCPKCCSMMRWRYLKKERCPNCDEQQNDREGMSEYPDLYFDEDYLRDGHELFLDMVGGAVNNQRYVHESKLQAAEARIKELEDKLALSFSALLNVLTEPSCI